MATTMKPTPILKSVAIHQLQALALELKRTPTIKDVKLAARKKKCPRVEVFKETFGSFRDALRAARLPLDIMQEFSQDDLLAQLRDLSQVLGRPLTQRDVAKAAAKKTIARVATFVRVFGSISEAFRRAGVQPTNRYTKNQLINKY